MCYGLPKIVYAVEDAATYFIRKESVITYVNILLFVAGDLCRPLNCKKRELCLLEDAYTAVCVSKKELHRNRWGENR